MNPEQDPLFPMVHVVTVEEIGNAVKPYIILSIHVTEVGAQVAVDNWKHKHHQGDGHTFQPGEADPSMQHCSCGLAVAVDLIRLQP